MPINTKEKAYKRKYNININIIYLIYNIRKEKDKRKRKQAIKQSTCILCIKCIIYV